MAERMPPHSIEAEQELLGAIFLDNACFGEALPIVRDGSYFYSKANGLIYNAMRELAAASREFTWITVYHHLERQGLSDEARGMAYLQELAEFAPTTVGAVHAAETIRDRFVKRSLCFAAHELRAQSYDPTTVGSELLSKLSAECNRLQVAAEKKQTKHLAALMAELEEDFRKRREAFEMGDKPGLSTGFSKFDDITGGLRGGEVYLIAARPGHGKSAWALNVACHVARRSHQLGRERAGGGCLYVSLEMPAKQLVERALGVIAEVNLSKLRSGEIDSYTASRLEKHMGIVAQWPLYIDDSFNMRVSELVAKVRRMKDQHGISLVVVDYVQLVKGDTRMGAQESRHLEVGEVSRGIKAMAGECDIPVIAAAQLNRQIEARTGARARPQLSDLRESGSLEQDADMVAFIERPLLLRPEDQAEHAEKMEYLRKTNPAAYRNVKGHEPANLIVAKNRSGPLGDCALTFRKECTRFETAHGEDLTGASEQEQYVQPSSDHPNEFRDGDPYGTGWMGDRS